MVHHISPRRLTEAITSLPSFPSAIGIRVVLAEPGLVHMSLTSRPDLLQVNGYFHGGALSGLADHAACLAVGTALPFGRAVVTLDLHVNFLRPAGGATVLAKARAIQVGKMIGVAAVEIFTGDDDPAQLCATSTVTVRVADMPRALLDELLQRPDGTSNANSGDFGADGRPVG